MSTALAQTAHDVGSRALHWLHAHRQAGALDGRDLAGDMEAYKALLETALAASLVLRDGASGSEQCALAHELLDFAWAQLKDGTLLYERLLRQPLATDAVEGYAHFARVGYRHTGMERLITHFAATGTARTVEYVPNRRLAIANALRVTGHDQSADDWERLTRATWLGSTPQPWHLDWMTGYAITHTVFHLTDWGRDPRGLPDDLAAYLALWLPVWTDVWAETGQWDLVGELLIIGSCLPEPYVELGDWQRLAEVQHADGLVPRDDHPVDDDHATRFQDHQHPTIVATVAGTIALTRALNTPPTRTPDTHA
ncbi:DUF6895 family protein [Streptomyces violaceus]|uniref:DUF6895 domain-containing protein n=1 Tax=Streptomyces violaceus TaxID=1936 RepID=A0ABY9TZX2_STRVL|nr:hypothetical protein [Streptomyces janthinus]WND15976.1 hypothetical protein RI060_00760 [Streptomyces janthinus]GGT00540.1 hypothetical protein GCM10010270_85420 [Streptomyces janthinus]